MQGTVTNDSIQKFCQFKKPLSAWTLSKGKTDKLSRTVFVQNSMVKIKQSKGGLALLSMCFVANWLHLFYTEARLAAPQLRPIAASESQFFLPTNSKQLAPQTKS